MISNVANLVSRRDLLWELIVTELKAATARTKLGWLWWMVDPLLMMLIYSAIVVGLLGRGRVEYTPYWLFIFFGLITWKHFSVSVNKAVGSISRRQGLIKSVPFPTMVLPLSHVFSGVFLFLFGFGILLVMSVMASLEHHSGDLLPLLQIPVLIVLQMLVAAGVALPVSCLAVLYRDLGSLMPHLLRIGFYLSPGLYGVDLVQRMAGEKFREPIASAVFNLYMLNPLAILMTAYRDSVFYGRFTSAPYWSALIVEAILVFAFGFWVFRYYDRRVIKFL